MAARLLVVLCLAIGACSSHDESSSDAAADTLGAEAGTAAAVVSAPPVVALDPEGFRLFDPASGSSRLLAFGSAHADVVEALTALRGEAAPEETNPECPAGPLTFTGWDDGLTMHSAEGQFVGWAVDGRAEGAEDYTTPAGVGIGSTREELDSVYDIRTGETSLGTEFAAGGLHGILDGAGTDGRITHLWGGTSCNFR